MLARTTKGSLYFMASRKCQRAAGWPPGSGSCGKSMCHTYTLQELRKYTKLWESVQEIVYDTLKTHFSPASQVFDEETMKCFKEV